MTSPVNLSDRPVLDATPLRNYRPTLPFNLESERIAAFASAIGETDPDRLAGRVSSPTYAFVPFVELVLKTFDDLMDGDQRGQLVHTHQRFVLHRELRTGDRLEAQGELVRLVDGPFGAILEVAGTLTDADGELYVEQLATLLVPGATTQDPFGEPFDPTGGGVPHASAGGGGSRPSAGGTLDILVARDLPARYAEASGDNNPIHFDPAVARAAGFPGVLVHGMASLALAVNAIETTFAGRGPMTALAIEWTRPVFPADRLTVRYEDRADDAGVGDVLFEVSNRRRRTVMRGGLVRFGASSASSVVPGE